MTADLVAGRPGPSVHFRNSYYASGRAGVQGPGHFDWPGPESDARGAADCRAPRRLPGPRRPRAADRDLTGAGGRPQRLPWAWRGVNGAVSPRLVWAALLVPAAWLLLTVSSGWATPAGSAAADGPLAVAVLRHGPPAGALANGL